jgi:hypothetical protein
MLVGIQLGRKACARSNPDGFLILVLKLLTVSSALSVVRALMDGYSIQGVPVQ